MTDIRPDHLTPVEAERMVSHFMTAVTKATIAFSHAGDALIEAKKEHRRAVVMAEFDPACPKVVRNETTVGQREAWVLRETMSAVNNLHAAEVMRETALEALRSARSNQQAAMAINASVREAYRMAVPT